MVRLEELADMPAQGIDARGAEETGPPQEYGRLPTINEESESGPGGRIVEVRRAELPDEREQSEAFPTDELYAAPTQMIADNGALVTVAEKQRGRLPAR
eukprot:8766238-Pyramimonas_sp.AAC.1